MSDTPNSTPERGLKAAIIPVTGFQQNCTLLWDPETMKGAIVDPGGDVDQIQAAIAQVGMEPEKILLTHGHIDHAGGAAELRERLGGIPIEGPHVNERPLLDNLEKQGEAYGVPARAVTPDRWLDEGETVSVAGHTFEVLHCPGHSPGSVVLVNRPQRFALMGDVLFQGSIGRTDLPLGNHEALMHSIRTKVMALPDEFVFICGHGPMSSIGQERRTNPFIVGDAA
ncbi:Hydroxyacylglutathione hydrolase GloC [Hyphomicrobium sp. 1Nfss2.1]|uniref:MBL fold metallo-hydrolase n=1 Tax=Hyphomicrobium sp. 1Nfss2.1 TaxID=3413936 RepID=UPI003C7E4F21